MNAIQSLENYLEQYQRRLKQFIVARGLAIGIAAFLIVSLAASYWAISSGFAGDSIWYGRLALLLVIAVSGILLIALPLRRLRTKLASRVERLAPEFDGRIRTFLSAESDSSNPMRSLLAEDALEVSIRNPPEKGVLHWHIGLPAAAAAALLAVILLSMFLAPGLMPYSLRHLYAGWMIDDLLPPQAIAVSPGDQLVRRGSNLAVRADVSGFQPDEASLFVKIGDDDWQEVGMTPLLDSVESGRAFDFTLFSVREPLTYYVSSMGIRSPNHSVEVIDLPGIKNLQVTYRYPEWTGLSSETLDQGGDIDALPGTGISLEVTTDKPLPAGELVLNGESINMEVTGESGLASFTIEEDGEYFLAARIGSEQVRLSDDYFIRVLEDQAPEIKFMSPGRDRNATSIEEVVTNIQVEDDYRLDNVELRYAVNGGEWQSVSLSTENRVANLDHTFYLEEIRAAADVEDNLGAVQLVEQQLTEQQLVEQLSAEQRVQETTDLVPGDLIAYYAVAEDRELQTQTDMFFIEVQPFDRRVSRAEQGGGGLPGGQGASEQEISQRQKEIIISTWNLIREQGGSPVSSQSAGEEPSENRIADSALLLSSLQRSLQEQAQSLLDTAESRRIDGDPRVSTFIEHMERAIAAMTPASERLGEVDLETAIQPEQEALQHLLRADAVFSDIQLSLNRGNAGAAGGGAGQDLAEMMELEIDFDQNQYETGSQASRESLEQETNDLMRELEDLARRQQQLADNMNRLQQPTEAQRWQQEMLRRDAEILQDRLDQLRQSEQSQQGTQAGAPSDQQQGSPAAASGEGQAQSNAETSETNRRLDSALDAMERASEAIESGDADQLRQAAGEAQRQLEGARSQMEEELEESLQRDFADMVRRAAGLYRDQAGLEETLLDGVRRAIASAPEGATSVVNPFDWDEEQGFAATKREMIAELQLLKDDMLINADRIRTDQPRVARIIEQADRELKESEIAIRMDIAANYMSRGESLYIANSESIVTRSLDDLSDTLEEAARELVSAGGTESGLDSLLGDIRRSGDALRDVAQGAGTEASEIGNPGAGQEQDGSEGEQGPGSNREPDGAGDAESQTADQAGGQAGAQGGQQAEAGNQPGGQAAGGGGNRWGGWDAQPGGAIGDAETQLGQLREEIGNLVPELRARGFAESQIAEINQLVRELQNASLNGDLSDRMELNRTLALLEQLQQRVEAGLDGGDGRVRSASPINVQLEYKEAVAEYYRRLSDDESLDDGASESTDESERNLR